MQFRDAVTTARVATLAAVGASGAKEGSGPTRVGARLAREAGEFFKGQPAGGVVRVTRGAQVLPRAAYGLSDIENGVPTRIDAALRLASIGKQFTATSPLAEMRAGQTNAMRRALLLCIEDTHIEDTAHPSAIAFRPTVP